MNADRWQQIDELVDAALEVPEAERQRFLAEKCGDDDDLKNEVLSLLKAQGDADNFMERSAMDLMGKALADERSADFDNSLYNKTIGNYRVEKPLGVGGMGEVYLAHDIKLNRKAALKILPKEFVADAERVKRFEIEASAVSALNHPCIVTVYDVGNIDGVNYIATEYVEGKNIRELIGDGLNLKETLSIVSQTVDALAAAHKAGIIHRDIKPENIMVRPDGFVKVLDFGLAKLIEPAEFQQSVSNYTVKGMIIGTPAYMSPAQVSGERVDHRTDLWSVGVILYEMLTGKNPFKGENRQETFQKILSENPPPVTESAEDIPVELNAILSKALEKDPDVSYQTASDLRADLKRVRREFDSSSSLRSASSSSTQRRKGAKAQSFYFLLFTFAFLLFASLGVWYFYKSSPAEKAVEAVEWAQAKNEQLTNTSGIKSYPSLSPDGKAFIYTNQIGDNTDIFLQRVGGKNPVNLTADSTAADWMGSFSPDGKFIVFRSERKSSGIYVMEETGENVRRVSDFGFHPSFSPDGKQIVVSDKSSDVSTSHTIPNSSLWTIDVATGNKNLLETKGDAIQPAWSPNGKRIAFWFVKEGSSSKIATIPAGGGEPIVVTEDSNINWNPIWSADGKYIYYGSDRGGSMNIWRVAINEETGKVSGEPESVPTPSMYIRHLSFSHDGKTLAYIRYETKSNLQTIAFDPEKFVTVGDVNQVTSGNNQVSTPALSPDGEKFVMRFPTFTQEDLVIFNRDGSNQRNLTNDKFRDRTPRWSPDGKNIAFASDRSGKYQIWMINADGSDLRQITFSEKTGAVAPIFSPDGLRIAFSEIDGKNQSPFTFDLTKSWQKQTPAPLPPIPNYQGSFSARDWSHDGNKLLLLLYETESSENGIVVFDFKTSTYEKMTDSGSYPIWLKDNRHFIFDKQNTLFVCDTETKKIAEIYKPPSYEIQHANVSADNRLLFFRYLQVDADVWTLEASPN